MVLGPNSDDPEVWQNPLKYMTFDFDNLTEIAYQISGFRQIIETGRVFEEIFFKFDLYHRTKVGCVFSMVVVSLLPHAELGRYDHREGAPYFTLSKQRLRRKSWHGMRVILSSSRVAQSKSNIRKNQFYPEATRNLDKIALITSLLNSIFRP